MRAGGGSTRAQRVDGVLLGAAVALAGLSMAKDAAYVYGASTRFSLTTLWQFLALVVAGRMIWAGSSIRLRRMALALSAVGSLNVLLRSRFVPGAEVDVPKSWFALAVNLALWCAPGIIAGAIVVRLPSTDLPHGFGRRSAWSPSPDSSCSSGW